MDEKKEITPLRRAVNWLIAREEISSDKDLQELFELSKGTISGYLSGTPGKDFVKNFEKRFNLSLSDFKQSLNDKLKLVNDGKNELEPEDKITQTLFNLSEANVKLADANQRQTKMLEQDREKGRATASDAQQMIEGALARHQAIQEVLQVYAKDGRTINVDRFEADVNMRISEKLKAGAGKVHSQNG